MSVKEWSGSSSEISALVEYMLKKIQAEVFPELGLITVGVLFQEAFCRNVVQNELREMMVHIHEEE